MSTLMLAFLLITDLYPWDSMITNTIKNLSQVINIGIFLFPSKFPNKFSLLPFSFATFLFC